MIHHLAESDHLRSDLLFPNNVEFEQEDPPDAAASRSSVLDMHRVQQLRHSCGMTAIPSEYQIWRYMCTGLVPQLVAITLHLAEILHAGRGCSHINAHM